MVGKPAKRAKPAAKTVKPHKTVAKKSVSTGDWRVATLDQVRAMIMGAVPGMIEERKWKKPSNPAGVPVWSHDGIVCTGETYKSVVKLTFAKGAFVKDPAKLFNASLEGILRRAIDIHEGETINAAAFKALIRSAAALNSADGKKTKNSVRESTSKSVAATPKLLSGGNPQIPLGYGDAPVRAYIAAMSGWKRRVGRKLDSLIVSAVPNVTKAVKWNTPLYGIEGQGWFLGFHCITKYIKVAFFSGVSLRPMPPVASKQKNVRYFHIHEDDQIDETRFSDWVKQASKLPGERM